MTKRLFAGLVVLLAAGALVAGNALTTDQSARAQDTSTSAATLRATLTAALQEHVYLAGIAIDQGVSHGLKSKRFKAATATLDRNSKGLAAAVGSVYGDAAGKQFLALWRKHIGFFVDYAAGNKKRARRNLDGYRTEFGAFLASANPNLTTEAVAEELKPHVKSVLAVIDAAQKGRASVFNKLRIAASHMPMTANVLASAIAKQFPEKFGSN